MTKKKRGNYKSKNVLLLSKVLKVEENKEDKEKKEDKKDGGN
jgi:hypothetical protein